MFLQERGCSDVLSWSHHAGSAGGNAGSAGAGILQREHIAATLRSLLQDSVARIVTEPQRGRLQLQRPEQICDSEL